MQEEEDGPVDDDGSDIEDQSDLDVGLGGPVGDMDVDGEEDEAKADEIQTRGGPRSVNDK